jgi:hypothetical protein
MQMNDIDGQMNRAQAEAYKDQFTQAMGAGRYDLAGLALANLANYDKTAAAMYQSVFPTYKENWAQDNKRQDAQTNFNYQQLMNDRNFQQKLDAMQYQAQLQRATQAGMLADKSALEQQAMLQRAAMLEQMGVPREQILAMMMGGGASNAVTSADGNAYHSADGQATKLSEKDLELQNTLNDAWENAWGAVNDSDNTAVNGGDGGADAVDEFTRAVIDNKSKMTPEAYSHYYSLAAACQFLREKGAGHENKAAELFKQISPEVKELYLSQY